MERICREKGRLVLAATKKQQLRLKIQRLQGEESRVKSKVSLEFPPAVGMTEKDVKELHQYQMLDYERKKSQYTGFQKLLEKMKRETR